MGAHQTGQSVCTSPAPIPCSARIVTVWAAYGGHHPASGRGSPSIHPAAQLRYPSTASGPVSAPPRADATALLSAAVYWRASAKAATYPAAGPAPERAIPPPPRCLQSPRLCRRTAATGKCGQLAQPLPRHLYLVASLAPSHLRRRWGEIMERRVAQTSLYLRLLCLGSGQPKI